MQIYAKELTCCCLMMQDDVSGCWHEQREEEGQR